MIQGLKNFTAGIMILDFLWFLRQCYFRFMSGATPVNSLTCRKFVFVLFFFGLINNLPALLPTGN